MAFVHSGSRNKCAPRGISICRGALSALRSGGVWVVRGCCFRLGVGKLCLRGLHRMIHDEIEMLLVVGLNDCI